MNLERSAIRNRVRIKLNDPNADTWDDNIINEFLEEIVHEYRERYVRNNPTDFVVAAGITLTYAGSEDYHVITNVESGDYWVDEILNVKDVTNAANKRNLVAAASHGDIQRIRDSFPSGVTMPTHYLFWTTHEPSATGEMDRIQHISLAPLPTSQRTILMQIQGTKDGDSDFDADTATTGLPTYAEVCIVLKAIIECRMMEENPNTRLLESRFAKAEQQFNIKSKQTAERDDYVEFDEDLIN